MELKKVFEDRRSVNFFDKEKALDEQVLRDIVDLAGSAPSAFNLQPWELVIVKSDEAKEKLYQVAYKQPKILEAPVTLIVVGDKEGYNSSNPAWSELADMMGGMDNIKGYLDMAAGLYGTSEARKLKFAESNSGLYAMALMAAAQNFGVASHPMSGIDFDGLKEAFNLGENKEVVMLISLGYFDESKQLYPRRSRKTFEEVAVFA